MKIEWTSAVPAVAVATLGDDSVKTTIQMEGLGGAAAEQVEPLFRAANATRIARGNVAGEFTFTAGKSHATRADALTYWKAEFGRLNNTGSLVVTEGASTLTFANAVLKSVILAGILGLRWTVRYSFGVTTVS